MPQSTTDNSPVKGVFALVKGETGSGKSNLAYSFPTPYVFDHDEKMPAIAKKHFAGKKIDWDTFPDIFGVEERIKELEEDCPYETLVVDTVTSVSYKALKTIDDCKGQNVFSMLKNVNVKDKPAAASNRARVSGTTAAETTKTVKTIELRGYDYYNGEDSFFKWYIDKLKFLWSRPGNPKHVLVLAHVLTSEQAGPPGTTIKTVTRRIVTAGSKIAAYIPAQFDELYHVATDQGDSFDPSAAIKHLCFFQGVGDDSAKTAYNLVAPIDFTNKSFYELMSDKVDIGRKSSFE
jgi:hypothetical protein